MTAWVKGNKVSLSLVALASMIYFIVHFTLAFSSAENSQDKMIENNTAQIESNAKAICDLRKILEEHIKQYGGHIEEEKKNADIRTRLTTDMDYIKKTLDKIERKME